MNDMHLYFLCLLALLSVCCAVGSGMAVTRAEDIHLPEEREHSLLAGNAEELARLRAAYRGTGAERQVVALMVAKADEALAAPVVYPPRGGQHNQWYQCQPCEMGLVTLEATRHQCPRCQTVYTGEPYDDVIFGRVHQANLRAMHDAAWAYAITGEGKYAEFAASILLGYAERYTKYPYHNNALTQTGVAGGHLFEQTLNESSAMTTTIAPAYDLIHASGALSADDHRRIREGLLLPMLRNLDRNKRGISNWQSWHNAAMITGGIVLGDAGWVRKALLDPAHGFLFQMGASVGAEGMWYENSWGYHFYTLQALQATAEAARRLGIDLWADPRLRKMCTLPARCVMPNGQLPRFGDDVNTSLAGRHTELEIAYHAMQDPVLLPLLAEEPTFHSVLFGRKTGPATAPPAPPSELLPGVGHAYLRGPAPAGLTAVLAFGPFGGFHGHFDKLSFILYGHGEELGVDRGRAASQAYRLPIHTQWYRATISHNTVLADRQSQQGVAGALDFFDAREDYTAVGARCDAAYPGVTHARTLVMRPHYVLVIDELATETARRFDWLYHNRGHAVTCEAAVTPGEVEADYPGLQYLREVRTGTADGPLRVRFAGERVSTHLLMAGEPGTRVLIGDGPGSSVLERIPLTMITREGTRARFVAALEPAQGNAPPTVTAVEAEERDGALVVRVRQGAHVEEITLTPGVGVSVR